MSRAPYIAALCDVWVPVRNTNKLETLRGLGGISPAHHKERGVRGTRPSHFLLSSPRGVTMKLAAAVLLASLTNTAFAATSLSIAMQNDAPVQIQSTTHGLSDALESAVFTNRSGKSIISYRMGWISVTAGKAQVHRGVLMNVPGGLAAGTKQVVPAQGIPFSVAAENMTFFITDITFADRTHWRANTSALIKHYGPKNV